MAKFELVQNASMRRLGVAALLVMAVLGASCTTQVHHASTVALPRCGPEAPDATYSSTTTSPCIPTSTTTTTTTLPAPLALGSAATLSIPSGSPTDPRLVVRISVDRAWPGATPVLAPDGIQALPESTLVGFMNMLLARAGLPAAQPITWIGVKATITTSGARPIAVMSPGGPGNAYLDLALNGSSESSPASVLALSALGVGIVDCPFLWRTSFGAVPSSSVSGCFAVAVPAGTELSTFGFDLTSASGGAPHAVARWQI